MDKTAGSAHRLIQVPGYHIHPEWDLHHLRHILHHKRKKKSFSLMLAPMVDMMSILVIYLITNFSATGEAFFVGRDVKIPEATKGRPMESNPLVTILKDRVLFDALSDQGGGVIFLEDLNDGQSPKLRAKLGDIKKLEEQLRSPAQANKQINIQADRSLEMDSVKKVMRVLIEEGWSTLNFIIEPIEGSGS
jgi:biopolymer transport protein ExbD